MYKLHRLHMKTVKDLSVHDESLIINMFVFIICIHHSKMFINNLGNLMFPSKIYEDVNESLLITQ